MSLKEDEQLLGSWLKELNNTSNQVRGVGYYSKLCNDVMKHENLKQDSMEYKVAAATCGWGYKYENQKHKKWHVVLLGEFQSKFLRLLGITSRCPLNPLCKISHMPNHTFPQGDSYNVFIVNQKDAEKFSTSVANDRTESDNKNIYKVLYWREANIKYVPKRIQRLFDFEMGIHYHVAGILNPVYLRGPLELLSMAINPFPRIEFTPPEQRRFGISIISDCNAKSLRDHYLAELTHLLGTERINRFGRCVGKSLPGNLLSNQARLISKYKFYFAFENTIQSGYVTEKLFFSLNIPILPVYYGWIQLPNITKTPSFIRVADFNSPKSLANYLLYLDATHTEYMKFHEWRWKSDSFEENFLKKLSKDVAGPDEQMIYVKQTPQPAYPSRSAQFCRLCDPDEVERLSRENYLAGSKRIVIEPPMNKQDILQRFFS